MTEANYQDAELILRLYDLRREERLRTARAWFMAHVFVTSAAEVVEKFPPGSDHNAFFRMVLGYWDMAASFLNRGIVHEELFLENNTELLAAWERSKGFILDFRKVRNNPMIFRNLEEAALKSIGFMNRNAPGSYETFLKMIRPKG